MLKFGKSEVGRIAAVLDAEHETLDDAARAVLAEANAILEARAKFAVVGQLSGNSERRVIPPSDPEAIKVCLGLYSTEGDARSHAESLWTSTASGDTFRVWVLPTFHGTPAELHGKRKEQYVAAQEKAKEAQQARLRASIEKRQQEANERAAGGKGSCETCSHQSYDHGFDGSSRGACKLTGCECSKWKERKK